MNDLKFTYMSKFLHIFDTGRECFELFYCTTREVISPTFLKLGFEMKFTSTLLFF